MAKRSTPVAATAGAKAVSSAAQGILDDLAAVLREAGARGVDLDACFRHFDRRSEGLVDVDAFMAAVTELRIGGSGGAMQLWNEADAESCVECISGCRSRACFTRADFLRFFGQQARPLSTTAKSRVVPTTRGKKATKVVGNANYSQLATQDYVDAFRRGQQHASLSDATRMGIAPRSKKQKVNKQSLLPVWARDRSKRALQELENLQQRKRRLPPSVSSRLFYHDEQDVDDGDGRVSADDSEEPQNRQHEGATAQLTKLKLPESALNQDDLLEFPVDSRWRTFDLDDCTAIAYAILSHDTATAMSSSEGNPVSSPSPSKRLSSAKYAASSEEDIGSGQPNFAAFRFTVILDAFQQLETLESFFLPLLIAFPRGKILVCGFPARTTRKTVWNNDSFAQAYAKLLVYLMRTTREWLVQPKVGVGAVPQLVVAFGSGASTALRLLAVEIPRRMQSQPQLQLFMRGQRGLVLINGLAHTSESARRSLQTLKRALARVENRVEIHEAMVQSVFSEFYLTQVAVSRRAAMETFFKTRKRFLEAHNQELLRVLLHGAIKNKEVKSALDNLRAADNSPFSLVLVHGTLNALFGADQVELVTAAFPPECLAPSLAACLSTYANDAPTPQVHVSWLKSGHEVLQERSTFMHDLFRQLVLVDAGATASVSSGSSAVADTRAFDTHRPASATQPAADTRCQSAGGAERPQVPATNMLRAPDAPSSSSLHTTGHHHQQQPPSDAGAFVKRAAELLELNGIKWIQQELYDRGLEGSGTSTAILERFQQALASEYRQEREKQAHEAIRRARQDAREAQLRERQREELDRQMRETEAQARINQREHEAQRAFFVQMEAQKQVQARLALELELMALEDVHSQRREEQASQACEREHRNTEMALKVEEIEAGRLEQERERYQVALQQQRLVAQHEKREQLKRFQKEFEQNELVSSPVEAYMLDLAPTFDNFRALSDGARALAKDLVHFYELKISQKDESAERRVELDELRQTAAANELAVRNLERVILKAKSTGMIARAGLGTVRIVPITTLEFQALTRELDEKQDALARVQHELTLRAQELAWKDTLLQRLSELIKRNEGFRVETIEKLQGCAETGNEMVLCAREDGEKLFELRESNAKLEKRCARRLHAVREERTRAGDATTEFFDTRLRVEGATQRVHRAVLLREHDAEIEVLEQKVAEQRASNTEIETKLRENKLTLDELGAQTFYVEQSLQGLEQAIAARADASHTDKTVGGMSSEFNSVAAPVQTELAEHVRRKPHASRSAEEKQWVALDFRVNFAHYYKCVALEEVEIISKHADYQQQQQRSHTSVGVLSKDQIEHLLALPARNCLALAFFKSPEELQAHFLLRKYTCGDGEDYFASHDDAFALDAVRKTAAIVTTKLEELPEAVAAASTRAKAAGVFIDRGHYALLDENAAPVTLISASQCEIQAHKSATHTFKLPAAGVGVLSLMVSVVFQGHFRSSGYQNGRLAGMLYLLPSASADGLHSLRAPVAIGKCFYQQDIALCTPHSLGKLVLRHDPRAKPLCSSATYQVVLGAPVFTAYSIEVTAKTALFSSEVLRTKRSDALKQQELLPLRKDEIQNVFVTIQLSERKKRLAKKMANDARDAARVAELEMIRSTKQLEADNAALLLGHEERAQLHAAIRDGETKFTHQCFLYAKREEEARDIESGLQELTRIHADLLQQCDDMERDLATYRAHLPQLAAALVDSSDPRDRDAAGTKVARELNAEYESAGGAKSGKVLWAEISAMKARLPSMMTPAERLRRKYKKGRDVLEKKEREWIIVDRILHPRVYDWEARLGVTGDARMRLHGAFPKLTKDEEQLAVLSHMEVDRIMKAPWNLLERREIQIRKIVTKFRDDRGAAGAGTSAASRKAAGAQPATTMVALLRSQKTTELTTEEREWRLYDQLLNPSYYPLNVKKLADEMRQAIATPGGAAQLQEVRIAPNVTREDIVAALNTPEEELFKLQSDLLRARNLLLKFDPQLSVNLVEAARIQHGQATKVEIVEMDVDARCRLVYQELQRAVANTRNEFMDSHVLHSTLQRFPTKVLRLELEKELDRLLMGQVTEKEEFELRTFLSGKDQQQQPRGVQETKSGKAAGNEPSDSLSDSDSDEEAQIARDAKARRQAKLDAKSGKNAKIRGKALKQKSIQKQRREIKDVRAAPGDWLVCMAMAAARKLIISCCRDLMSAGAQRTKSRRTSTCAARTGTRRGRLHGVSSEPVRMAAVPARVERGGREAHRSAPG